MEITLFELWVTQFHTIVSRSGNETHHYFNKELYDNLDDLEKRAQKLRKQKCTLSISVWKRFKGRNGRYNKARVIRFEENIHPAPEGLLIPRKEYVPAFRTA